jgi:hypothetical protein
MGARLKAPPKLTPPAALLLVAFDFQNHEAGIVVLPTATHNQ